MKHKRISRKIIFFIVLFIVMWLIYQNKEVVLPLIQKIPFFSSIYNFITIQIEQKSFLGLAALSFFGALFFVFLPVDIVFIYYLSLGYNKLLTLLIVLFCYMLGLTLDYFLGFIFGKKIFSKKEPEKLGKRINKFGSLIIVLGYLFFLPMQFITTALGAFKYPFKKFLYLTLIMLSLKFLFIIIAGNYFLVEILPKIKLFF